MFKQACLRAEKNCHARALFDLATAKLRGGRSIFLPDIEVLFVWNVLEMNEILVAVGL